MRRFALLFVLLPLFGNAAVPDLPAGATVELIEIDDSGNAFIAGSLPTEAPPRVFDIRDAFVAKYRLDTGAIVFITRFADPDYHAIRAIALGTDGSVYVAGFGAATARLGGTPMHLISPTTAGAFVGKLSSTGSVVYATILGKSQFAADIAVNSAGEAYVTGDVLEGEMPPTPGAAVTTAGSARTSFVAKLNSAGDKLLLVERGIGGNLIKLDAAGSIYVAGTSGGKQDPPITANAFQQTRGSCLGVCQHIAKLDSTGGTLLWSTYLGGSVNTRPNSMQIDIDGSVIVAGTTQSSDFPVTAGVVGPKFLSTKSIFVPTFALLPAAAPETGFVAKLNPAGSALVFSTFLGGSRSDGVTDLRLSNGQIYLSGAIGSEDLQSVPKIMQECLPASFVVAMTRDGKYTGNLHVARGSGGPLAIAPDGFVYTTDLVARDLNAPVNPVYCAVDAASGKEITSVAPGQLISLFGPDMANGIEFGTPNLENVLPGNLGWRIANFEGAFAKFLYTSKRQANIVVPYEIAGKSSVTMQWRLFVGFFNDLIFSMPFTVIPRSPTAFQLHAPIESCGFSDSRFTPRPYFYRPTILALNENGSLNSCTNPAKAGSTATIFINGGGVTGGTPLSGLIASQPTPVSIGTSAQQVTLVPGSVNSVWQAKIRIPPNAQTGPTATSVLLGGLPVTTDDFFLWTTP